MTSECKSVLDDLIKLTKNTDEIISQVWGYNHFCLSYDPNAYFDYSKYAGEIDAIIHQLFNDGYIEFTGHGHDFRLTHKGLHYKKYKWIETKRFLLTSIVVPIVVSAITALVTLWLQAQL